MDNANFDLIIIGAGGAGLMCGGIAGQMGLKVLILDHNDRIGRKILISGGGRCNFTNTGTRPESFVSNNKHFAKSALSRFTPQDFIQMVEKHGIRYHEKKLGQLFCDGSAEQIVEMLLAECRRGGCRILTETRVDKVTKEEKERFKVSTTAGVFSAAQLVVATGGLSIPQIGATGFGYDLARQFGLKVTELAPALDGFVWGERDLKRFGDLSGISLDTVMSCGKASFRENILFTHTGLSGPASLQTSLYWKSGAAVSIDLAPAADMESILMAKKKAGSKQEIKNVLGEVLPKRFAEYLSDYLKLSGPLAGFAENSLAKLAANIHKWQITPGGTVGYRKAEVTRGGVDTDELSSQTMEAKKVPGLYFIGEVVDVTGMLGGYNFQWAWASAAAAARSMKKEQN